MPLRNRVDPFGDLHAEKARGLFTGNRGCLVDDDGQLTRHHRGNLWITCVLDFKGWRHPLAKPGTWTPLFFLDDAVALAAGHRPCGLCRRQEYEAYRSGVARELGRSVKAGDVNRLLQQERLNRGQGLERASDRKTWTASVDSLPTGTVVLWSGVPHLINRSMVQRFSFTGWQARQRPPDSPLPVLTPRTSVSAIGNGFDPVLHPSAMAD